MSIRKLLVLLLCIAPGVPGGAQTPTRVLVIPFSNLSGMSADDWIAVGIAESIGTELAGRGGFDVFRLDADAAAISRGASVRSDDQRSTARQAALAQGASHVISGWFRRIAARVRIIGQFVSVADDTVIRSVRVDGTLDELSHLQDQLVSALIGAAPPAPAAIEARKPGDTLEATQVGEGSPTRLPAEPVPPPVAVAGALAPGEVAASREGGFKVGSSVVIDGPPPPIPPDVMRRDEEGRTTVRAIKLTEGILLDGQLDEAVYQTVPAITGLIQQVPNPGAPATERTEAWIMFDRTSVYVSARLWDSAPESEWVANEMRRDTSQLRQNDTFAAFFDTFYDRRNGYHFYTNPLGARADQQFTNEGNPNADWNPVWDVRTGRFDGGWTVEMEIPFKTLRYRSRPSQVWGVQLRRAIRRKNEWVYLTRLPISAGGGRGSAGIFRVSAAGTLVGIEPPPASRNIEIKPYAIGGLTTDLNAAPALENEGSGDFGLDVKYGITQNLTADFTYNTDFAQVEVDEQQVNLTRFSLFFPEKREFFLEGRGIFEFARGGVTGRFGGPGGGFFGGGNAPTLFYSRRIGLDKGRMIPILGGGRITGKIGQIDVGALNIQTGDELVSGAESSNFSVLRVKRDILRRSSVGGIVTNRSVATIGTGASQTYGVDGTFAFYDAVNLLGYVAKTSTPTLGDKDFSYQAKFDYAADRYGLQVDHLLVEDNFVPDVGFLRRDNFRRTYVLGRFSPRPASIDAVRQFSLEGSSDYILSADTNVLETRLNQVVFDTEFEASDRLTLTLSANYELLTTPFTSGPDTTIPVGGYDFTDIQVAYAVGQQRRVNGQIAVQRGGYFNGDITALSLSQGRIGVLPQMSIEPSISFNWIDTPQGSFRADLALTRINYAFNPRMFFSGLVQYNSANETVSNNLRFRWEYSPGSELFVVYTEDRGSSPLRPDRRTELGNRGLLIKLNRLFRY